MTRFNASRWVRSMAGGVIALAIGAGAVGAACAQSNDSGVAPAGMPAVKQSGDVSYVTGGVGLDESHALKAAAPHWPVELLFAGPGSDYLSDVHVDVTGGGGSVFHATADGPYMLVKLPPGDYVVHASYKGEEKTQAIKVGGAHQKASFRWNTQ
ncbi:carboxypeptidase regulatory-like domain-containing protein [Pararobbsia silviterrae]|uniref:Carboxypeptidase regulatory-like domain-containing protein n=1 Tax=Pararobbsia silviterrae TaxID=1792498 RepID=A0A494YB78_9BURK|nr:carboxypeptidase regulatory-like domain-containing protein [Pararobbsia silviterrae]RKP59010.1 carboxypeptidase regulatory-like domain-containing protein [Pararobbsia silviterrae]